MTNRALAEQPQRDLDGSEPLWLARVIPEWAFYPWLRQGRFETA